MSVAAERDAPRVCVVGVRRARGGPVRYLGAAGIDVEVGDHVLVPSPNGPALARVVIGPTEVAVDVLAAGLPALLRRPTAADVGGAAPPAAGADLLGDVRVAVAASGHALQPTAADLSPDGARLLILYRSERDQLDLTGLAETLAIRFQTRVELRDVDAPAEPVFLSGPDITLLHVKPDSSAPIGFEARAAISRRLVRRLDARHRTGEPAQSNAGRPADTTQPPLLDDLLADEP